MMSVFSSVLFATCFCFISALEYRPNATQAVAKTYGVKLPEKQDTTKVLKFLQAFMGHRSLGWENVPKPKPKALYYVSAVKLSSEGDVSCIMKKDSATTEYLVLDGSTLTLNDNPVAPVPGVIFLATNAPYEIGHQKSMLKGLEELGSLANNSFIQSRLPSLKEGTANVQVAVSVVNGLNSGNNVGEFLLVAAYIE